MIQKLLKQLLDDEAGFIVSAELVLIATIAVISMVVGLSQVSRAVNEELYDVAQAFNSVNQSYRYDQENSRRNGSRFDDQNANVQDEGLAIVSAGRGER